NGGYYILTTGSGSPQWIDWTNPDVLAANEQLYYQEVLRPIILDVWAQIVDKDFVFPITLNGDAGAMDSNKEIFYDNGNPIGLRVTNTYIGYTKGDTIISGTQFIDLDDKMIGDETGTISVTGANTATVEFHVTIGPRGDGHSIENGGYYMISLNGGASVRVEWVAPPLPGVPPGVAATDGEYYDRIVVSWGSVDDANHYEVQRASGSGDGIYYTIAEKVSSDTSYSDTTAVEGIDYYYRVRTVNENGSSEYSTYNKGTIKIDPVAPDAPTTISASKGIVDGKVIISWNVVPRANFYRVYRANTVSGAYAVINGFVTVASCEDTTVADKTLYYYRVTSVNEYGESDLSSKFDYGYPGSGYTPPDAPAGVSATDGTEYNKVTITWNGVGTDLNETDYYRVYRSAAIDGEYVQVGADITDTGTYPDSYTFYDSTVYRTSRYYYKVKAFNNYGGSDYSSADQGYGEITVEQFYSIFVDTVNYVNAKIYAEFDYPWIGDEKTFSGDVGGSFYFRVHSAWFQLYATINYSSLDEGDLDPNTTGDSSGMILNGSVEKKTGIITGNGAQTGTVTVTGDLAGTCVYNLEIKGGSVSGGYTRVTYNGDTTDISY
ncbi:MAG: hypothetical protein GY754_09655, partial [bacterium]|nr:hypothetical protein [bacterium]